MHFTEQMRSTDVTVAVMALQFVFRRRQPLAYRKFQPPKNCQVRSLRLIVGRWSSRYGVVPWTFQNSSPQFTSWVMSSCVLAMNMKFRIIYLAVLMPSTPASTRLRLSAMLWHMCRRDCTSEYHFVTTNGKLSDNMEMCHTVSKVSLYPVWLSRVMSLIYRAMVDSLH